MSLSAVSSRDAVATIPSLDGTRGPAALLVFWYHARWKAGDPELRLGSLDVRSLLQHLDFDVCVFFGLSGYLLARAFVPEVYATKPPIDRIKYLARRLARILPLCYFVLFVFGAFGKHTYTFCGILDLLLHAAGLDTWATFSYGSISPVLWSISIELQFYLLLPVTMLLLRQLIPYTGIAVG